MLSTFPGGRFLAVHRALGLSTFGGTGAMPAQLCQNSPRTVLPNLENCYNRIVYPRTHSFKQESFEMAMFIQHALTRPFIGLGMRLRLDLERLCLN